MPASDLPQLNQASPRAVPIHWDACLVEGAVLRCVDTCAREQARAFRAERDRIYAVREADRRERLFADLHMKWFVRLGMDRPIVAAVSSAGLPDFPVHVIPARAVGAELADLVRIGPERFVVIRVAADTLADPGRLRAILPHELMHVHDMLDPGFGYEPDFPPAAAHRPETILRQRYRVVWDTTIDGRLAGRGTAAVSRSEREVEFAAVFGPLGRDVPAAFERWWNEARPTHDAIVAFILDERLHGHPQEG